MNKAVFLDRDGTIIHDPGYLSDLKNFRLYKNSAKALKLLKRAGYKLIVLTNQSGVARGYYGEDFVEKTHRHMDKELGILGASVDAYYYCPHHKESPIAKYKKDCECRKPKPGMVNAAAKKFKLSLKDSFVIGDKLSDVKLGINTGMKSILVLTGKGRKEKKKITKESAPDMICSDIYSAAKRIVEVK